MTSHISKYPSGCNSHTIDAFNGVLQQKPGTYRLLRDTHVVNTKEGKTDLITIPEGSIITTYELPLKETGLILIEWDGMILRMFAIDLEHRATLVGEN